MSSPKNKTYWSASPEDCLAGAIRAYIEEGRVAQTIRHYYYKLLSYGLLRRLSQYPTSGQNAYKWVGDLLTDARHNGDLSYSAVIDPGRRRFTHWSTSSLGYAIWGKMTGSYTPDLWRGQERRLEVWVEKDAMANFVNDVVSSYRVPVNVSKGNASTTVIEEGAQRYGTGKGWTLLYCGDFDPTGIDIDRHLRDELARHGCYPDIVRVGLNQSDAALLPPEAALELNVNDTRTPAFIRTYDPDYGPYKYQQPYTGKLRGYELDAMPASQLRERLRDAVLGYIDADEWNAGIAVGKRTADAITEKLRGVFRGVEQDWLDNGVPGLDVDLDTQRRYLLPENTTYEDYEVSDFGNEDEDEDDNDDDDDYDALHTKRGQARSSWLAATGSGSTRFYERYRRLDDKICALLGITGAEPYVEGEGEQEEGDDVATVRLKANRAYELYLRAERGSADEDHFWQRNERLDAAADALENGSDDSDDDEE